MLSKEKIKFLLVLKIGSKRFLYINLVLFSYYCTAQNENIIIKIQISVF